MKHYGPVKPRNPVEIDWGHPLAQGLMAVFLFNEEGGPPCDLVSGKALTLDSGGIMANFSFGIGLEASLGASCGAYAVAWDRIKPTNRMVSLLWRGNMLSTGSDGSIIGVSYSNTNDAPYHAFTIAKTGSSQFLYVFGTTGSSYIVGSAFSPAVAWDGTERQFAMTLCGVGNAPFVTLYEGSNVVARQTDTTNAFSPTYSANSRLILGGGQLVGTRASGSQARHAYLWNRVVTQAEYQWLWNEPYAFIRPRRKIYGLVGIVPLTLSLGDAVLGSFQDSVVVSNDPATLANLEIHVSDQFELSDSINIVGGDPDYHLSFSDFVLANLQDSVGINLEYRQLVSDTLQALTDLVAISNIIPIQAFDSLQFNWADSVELSFLIVQQLSDSINNFVDDVQLLLATPLLQAQAADSINNWADFVRMFVGLVIRPDAEIITITDNVKLQMSHLLRSADALSAFLDAVGIDFISGTEFSDSIANFDDSAAVQLIGCLSASVEDSLSFSDSAAVELLEYPIVLRMSVADNINNFSDSASLQLNAILKLTLVIGDSINNFSDAVSISAFASEQSRIRRYLGDL